jgi:hypothetical protein
MTVSNVIDELLETLVFGDPRRRYISPPPVAFLTIDFQDPAFHRSVDVTRFENRTFNAAKSQSVVKMSRRVSSRRL